MKKLIFTVLGSAMLLTSISGYTQDKVKVKKDEMKVKSDKKKMKMEGMANMDMPYKANYSSQFAMNDQAHAKKVLELWKDYDENMLDRHSDYFADSLVVELPDGTRFIGKEAAMKSIKEYRSGQGKVESTVNAWISTKSLDKNEDWVCIWGVETATDASGKETKTRLHEIWQLNKDGKVIYMAQFMAKPAPEM